MDKNRILNKLGELDGYLDEIDRINIQYFDDYRMSFEKKRACERLLQISIEVVIDICNIIIKELRLGLPSEEDDIFKKLEERKIISRDLCSILIKMKGFRNILVHKYENINDELVFEFLKENLEDFDKFKEEILKFIN